MKNFIIFVLMFTLISCKQENTGQLHSIVPECDPNEEVTFSGFIEPLMDQKCSKCHNAMSGNLILCNYSEVIKSVESGRLLGSLLHLEGYHPMPQEMEKLDDCTLDKIKSWIEAGAPEN